MSKQNPGQMNRDTTNWFGPFYFNRNDPRIIVPKMDPTLGGTFNLASPYALIILLVLVVVIVITAIYRF